MRQTNRIDNSEGRRTRKILARGGTAVLAAIVLMPVISQARTVLALRGGTVITMTGETIEQGTVLIVDGKIAEVGKRVKIPREAVVVDVKGKYLLPGLIDAMCYYGLRPDDRNEAANPVTPRNRAISAYFPFEDFAGDGESPQRDKELLRGGITSIYIAPGNRQIIGGQGAVVKTSGADLASRVVLEPAAMDIAMGSPVKEAFGSRRRSPFTRMSIAAQLRKILLGAHEFVKKREAADQKIEEAREAVRKNKKNGEKQAHEPPKRDQAPRDLGMEAMARLVRREIPARIEADLPDDIRTALRIAEEFGIDIVIDGGIGAYRLRRQLAEKKIPVVLGPISQPFTAGGVPSSPELYTMRNERGAALLAEAGVEIALASFGYDGGLQGSAYRGRWLLLEAALAAGFGLSEETALKAVTINPARILGVHERLGSLEPGKDADLIVLDGPPLDVRTWVEKVYIDGRLVYSR